MDVIKDLGGDGLFYQTDMSEEDSVRALVQETIAHYGRLDIIVNNAGIFIPGDTQSLTVAEWDQVTAVNIRGIFIATKYAIPHL